MFFTTSAFMKTFLTSLLFTLSVFYFQQIDINALKKDTSLIQYKKISSEILDDIKSRKYIFPANAQEILKGLEKNPSREQTIKLFKEGGMANVEEYFDKVSQQGKYMFEFMRNHPELAKMERKALTELLVKLISN